MSDEPRGKFEEYIAAIRETVTTERHFELHAVVYDSAGDGYRQRDEIGLRFAEVYPVAIRPLLAKAGVCRIYRVSDTGRHTARGSGVEITPERVEHWRESYLHGAKGAYEVQLTTDVLDDVEFWLWVFRCGPIPVFAIDRGQLDVRVDFAPLRDPVVVGNTFTGTAKSPLKWALKETDRGDRIAFIGGGTVYSVDLSVVSTADDMIGLLEAALAHGNPSPDFIRGWGTYYVEPLEIGGYDLWIRLNSNRDKWTALLFEALERADEQGDDDARVLLDGLVAAELVASLAGRPPASYGRRELRRAKGLAEWVERLAPKNPFGPQVRDLARRIVTRTREHSVLPQRLWRTAEPRQMWHEAMRDLERRLS